MEVNASKLHSLEECSSSEESLGSTTSYQHTDLLKVLEALPAGVVVLDGSGYVGKFNKSATALLDHLNLGTSWQEIVYRNFLPKLHESYFESLKSGKYVQVTTCPLEEGAGQILLFLDITEQIKLEAIVNQQTRLSQLGEMAASLAHQIRTPLSTAILTGSQLRGMSRESDSDELLSTLLASLRRMENLVSDMLLFSKCGYSVKDRVDFEELLLQLSSLANSILGEKCDFSLKSKLKDCYVLGNRSLLLSVFENLIVNSLQAGATQVILHARFTKQSKLTIQITDNGSGVEKSKLDDVFEPFFTTRENGTGLGLSVVKSIVQAHSGEMLLESGAAGTCFTVILPTVMEDPSQKEL